MLRLYKHNKGKWLLSTVVSKNTASNEEKWRSLRGRPVMCHWPTLRPKINHERGGSVAGMWSPLINRSACCPSLCVALRRFPRPPHVYKHLQELNQHKWRWIADIYGHICIDYPGSDLRGFSLRSWHRKMNSSFILLNLFTNPSFAHSHFMKRDQIQMQFQSTRTAHRCCKI